MCNYANQLTARGSGRSTSPELLLRVRKQPVLRVTKNSR